MFTRILHWINRKLNPPKPKPGLCCQGCGAELTHEIEVERGTCVDCMGPAIHRPRPLGNGTIR